MTSCPKDYPNGIMSPLAYGLTVEVENDLLSQSAPHQTTSTKDGNDEYPNTPRRLFSTWL